MLYSTNKYDTVLMNSMLDRHVTIIPADTPQVWHHYIVHGQKICYDDWGKPKSEFVSFLQECVQKDEKGFDLRDMPEYKNLFMELAINVKLKESFIEKYIDIIDFKLVSEYQILSEEFIRKYIDKVDLQEICDKQKLSEQFVRDYLHMFDETCWANLSENKVSGFTESFFREFADFLQWDFVGECQPITKEFLREFAENISYGNFKWNFNTKMDQDERCEFMLKYEEEMEEYDIKKVGVYKTVADVIYSRVKNKNINN